MFDAYAAVADALLPLCAQAAPVPREALCFDARGCEISAPLGHLARISGEKACARLAAQKAANPPLLFGAPLLEKIFPSGDHVCFVLSATAYSGLMEHILSSCELPPLPSDDDTLCAYALGRMRMLARKQGSGSPKCPSHPAVRRALWRSMGIPAAEEARREALRERAAQELVAMLRGVGFAARQEMAEELGAVGGCAARLLGYEFHLKEEPQ